jgi:methionyl-tRNA formyltransferase
MEVDYGFIFTFRKLKENIYNAPKFGCINFHPSLLPINRGASPSNWIILNNQPKTGITFHFVSKEIDAGDIIEQYEIPLSGYETAKILNEYLFSIGTLLFVRLILRITHNYKYRPIKNDISIGTYKPLFKIGNSIITNENTFPEISSIVRASRIYDSFALFKYSGKEFLVLNCADLTGCDVPLKEYPFLDDKNNIYLRSSDNKIVLLVTKKQVKRNMVNRFIHNLKERTFYETDF